MRNPFCSHSNRQDESSGTEQKLKRSHSRLVTGAWSTPGKDQSTKLQLAMFHDVLASVFVILLLEDQD